MCLSKALVAIAFVGFWIFLILFELKFFTYITALAPSSLGSTVWDDYFQSVWNVLFTQLPIMAMSVFDKDFRFQETLLAHPELYKEVRLRAFESSFCLSFGSSAILNLCKHCWCPYHTIA